MVNKKFIFSIIILLSISYIVSALDFSASVSPSININRTANTRFNISITSGSDANITLVQITLGDSQSFVSGSNLTTANSVNFTNTTSVQFLSVLIWNTTQSGFPNATIHSFYFNATATSHGDKTITINVTKTNSSLANNVTTKTVTINFEFSGYVKNETAGNVTGANVTVYQFIQSFSGPPTETAVASVLTDNNGSFAFNSINGSDNFGQIMYTFKIIFRNATDGGNARKVSSVLPPFPANMYYPFTFQGGAPGYDFLKPPALNGSTFYLQSAATLRLNATNGTVLQRFGYMVMDQLVGFPIQSNIFAKVNTTDIVVPIGRNYTVMFMRDPSQFTMNFSLCDGKYMNDTFCPSPPISNSTLGSPSEGDVVQVTQDLSISKVRLTGCVNINSGANNSLVNITNLIPRLMPWTGFVPPINANFGDINITRDINYTSSAVTGCSFAYYNISVIGAVSGLPWLIEFYAKNASSEAGNPGNSNVLAAFQNVSVTNATSQTINITLYRLTGTYWSGGLGNINTSTIRVNIQNSTGGAYTTGVHVDVRVKNPVFGTITYIIDSNNIVNGTFYIPVLNNSNYAKIKVFASDSPPKELTINLSANEKNITLVTMSDGRDAGFKKINSSGDFVPQNISSFPIQMRFLRYSSECNVINPPTSCEITSMNATSFNPFKALVAGKINMEMKIQATNTTLLFVNFDMLSAKQPPMESVIDDNASTANATRQIWNFGSFVPADVYDYVLVGMSYSDTQSASNYLNESLNINVSLPVLYDENWKVVWNGTRGDTSANLTDDFIDYNNSALYRGYLSSGGVNCSTIDSSFSSTPCHHNTTLNIVYMKVPHFSGIGPQESGSSVPGSSSSNTTSSDTSSTSSGGADTAKTYAITTSQFTEGVSKKLVEGDRVKITIGDNDTHYVKLVDVADDTAEVTVSSLPVTFFLKQGELGKADFDDDGYYDIQVLVESMTSKTAEINILKINEKAPEKPANQTITGGAVAETGTSSGENATTESANESSTGRLNIWPILTFIIIFLVLTGLVVTFVILKKKGIID